MRHAKRLMRPLLGIMACSVIAGCSSVSSIVSEFSQAETSSPVAPGAPSKQAIATAANTVATQAKLDKPIEISKLRPSPPSAPEPWMVCLRSGKNQNTKRTMYTLFFNGDTMKSYNLAAIIYDCEAETYSRVK